MPSFTIIQLAELLNAEFAGDPTVSVSFARHPLNAGEKGALAVATEQKFLDLLLENNAQAAVVPVGTDWEALGLKSAIFVGRPRYALAKITDVFSAEHALPAGINQTAQIDSSAKIGKNASIGAFVEIGPNVVIGDNAKIFSHCSIGARTEIGDNALMHSGARIGHDVTIGHQVIIHQNAVIGADGFSFVTPEVGAVEAAQASVDSTVKTPNTAFARLSSLGGVTMGDDVEIGACTTIDRGTLKNTIIGSGTKIDNQVQVGHNVEIGKGCLLCAQVGIAGSTTVGDRVVFGGQAGVGDHLKIGSDVLVAAASAVGKNVASGNIMMGSPALKRDLAVETHMALRRLPRLYKTVDKLKHLLITSKSDE